MAVEPSGGEAATGAAADLVEAPVRVFVLAADEGGPPPAVVARPTGPRLAPLRGREFVLLVETGGRVRDVSLPGTSAAAGGETGVLREFVFAPGDGPRRLSLRIE
jgi:hypothetical protein